MKSDAELRHQPALATGRYAAVSGGADIPGLSVGPVRPEAHAGSSARSGSRRRSAWRLAIAALSHEAAPIWIIGLALLLTSTSLSLGITADDHFHKIALSASSTLRGVAHAPWDLFAFASDSANNALMRDEGIFPWWTDLDLKLRFFRPLTSLSIWLDYQLWPSRPGLMHLHSMFWFAGLLYVVSQLYRRFAGSALLAGLGLFLFAVDDARAVTVAWICNRNALMALVFGFGALLAHDRARRDGDRRAAYFAPLLLALGLLAGEPAFQAFGFMFAYAVCIESGSIGARVRSLLPHVAVVVVWRVVYSLLGYGAAHSGGYIDPGHEPLTFAKELITRLPALLAAQFTNWMSEMGDVISIVFPSFLRANIAFTWILCGIVAALLYPLLRKDRVLRFWALGAVLATLPVCAVSPTDRVLTATALGGAPLLAALFVSLYERSYPLMNRWTRGTGGTLAVLHLAAAPLLLPLRTQSVAHFDKLMAAAAPSIPAARAGNDDTVVFINPPVDPMAMYFPLYRENEGRARPQAFRWLATGVSDLVITRVDASTLKLAPKDGFVSNTSQQMMRHPSRKSHVGETVALTGLTMEVVSLTHDDLPAEVLARFDRPLESANLRFLQWGDGHAYAPFTPPAIGESVTLPAVDLVKACFQAP